MQRSRVHPPKGFLLLALPSPRTQGLLSTPMSRFTSHPHSRTGVSELPKTDQIRGFFLNLPPTCAPHVVTGWAVLHSWVVLSHSLFPDLYSQSKAPRCSTLKEHPLHRPLLESAAVHSKFCQLMWSFVLVQLPWVKAGQGGIKVGHHQPDQIVRWRHKVLESATGEYQQKAEKH